MPSDNSIIELYYKAASNKVAIANALQDAAAQDLIIMNPDINTYKLDSDIDTKWEKYNQMTKSFRRKSDWIALDYFGVDNKNIYDIIKSIKLRDRIPDITLNNSIRTSDDSIYIESADESGMNEFEKIRCIVDKLAGDDLMLAKAKAIEFANSTGFIMICPAKSYHSIKELEDDHEAFELMTHDHQRQSNWKMEELFGYTNYQYYLYMHHMLTLSDGNDDNSIYSNMEPIGESSRYALNYGKEYLNKLIENNGTPNDLAESITNMLSLSGTFESIIAGDVISDVLDKYDGLTTNLPTVNLNVSDLPMYTPDEMIDMGIYSGDSAVDDSEWFQEYCDYFYSGLCTESFMQNNIKRVNELSKWNKCIGNIDPFKYGWNPYTKFTEANRVKADNRIKSIISEQMNTTTFIDLRGFEVSENQEIKLESNSNKSDLKPIFIALEEGKTPIFSDLVRVVSGGKFSHAMISFDSSMENLYSYGMDGAARKLGGFIIENIKKKPKDAILKVYCFFVNNNVFDLMKNNVEWFKENQKKTIYSWHKLFAYAFNIPTTSDNTDFICSEFVDKMIKIGGMNFTKTNSNLVAPNDIDRAAKKNRKVYTLFNDKIYKYNQNRIDKLVEKISTKAKPANESSIYSIANTSLAFNTCTRLGANNFSVLSELSSFKPSNPNRNDAMMSMMYNRLVLPCLEAKEIPIKITSHGDIIIKNLSPIDFESAYSKSHKLLIEYDKAENIEGMKKELAYLWYLNLILEKRIHAPTVKEDKKKMFEKARAKILNDFKTYIKVVQKHDKDFDFRSYFESSEYSDAAYKISGSTIKATLDLIKKII